MKRSPYLGSCRPALLGLIFSIVIAPPPADAAPPTQPAKFDGGAYFQVSPGIVAVVIHERGFARDARWAWPWSLGAGGMLTRGRLFKATIGGSLEYRILFIEDIGAHGVHALGESRIGVGNRRVWGYGLVGVGAAGTFLDFDVGRRTHHNRDSFYGFALQIGSGAQILLAKRCFVGGELDIDLGYYFPDYERSTLEPFQYHTVTVEVALGWYF